MKFSYLGPQAISGIDFWAFISAMLMKNHNLGTPLTEGAIFGKNPYISTVPVQSSLVRSTKKAQFSESGPVLV